MVPAIYRCKRCKKAGRPDTFRVVFERVSLEPCGFVMTTADGGRYPTTYADSVPALGCPQAGCGATVYTRPVTGRVTVDKCGARCLAAKGHSCDCSCGGANHGANY
jgi:hypothetical protein